MTRVTPSEVRDISITSLTDVQIQAFIEAANQFIADAKLSSNGVTAGALTHIEKFLAAHLLSTRDQRVESETWATGERTKFQGQTGMGLDATHYGQAAKMLDTSGRLATFAAGLKQARLSVISEDDID